MLIDVAILGDRTVIKKEAEKILKHKDLTIEIQRMWNVKTKVIPVIIGATGTVSKSFRKYVLRTPSQLHSLQQIPTQHDMLPQHLVYKNELNREYVIILAMNDETP